MSKNIYFMLVKAYFKIHCVLSLVRVKMLNQQSQKVRRKQLVKKVIKKLSLMTVCICFIDVSDNCQAEPFADGKKVIRDINGIKGIEKLREIAHLSTNGFVNAVAWSPDENYLAALSNYGTRVTVWATNNWKKISEFNHYGGLYIDNSFGFVSDSVVVTSVPKGRQMVDINNELYDYYNLMLWDIHTGKLIRFLPKDPDYKPYLKNSQLMDVFTVGNKLTLIAGIKSRYPDSVSVLNAQTGEVVFTRAIPMGCGESGWGGDWLRLRNIKSVAFSKDEKYLLVGTGELKINNSKKLIVSEGQVYIVETKSGNILKSLCVYRSEYDKYLCDLSRDDYIRLLNSNEVRHVVYSPDCDWIATAGNRTYMQKEDDMVVASIWSAKTGEKISDVEGQKLFYKQKKELMPIIAMAWYGDWLLTGDASGELRIYSMIKPQKPIVLYKNSAMKMAYLGSISVSSGGKIAFGRDDFVDVIGTLKK